MQRILLIACLIVLPGATSAQPYDQQTSGYPFGDPHVFSPQGRPEPATHLYAGGNECGPDRPSPVWGPNGALLGYACETPPSNAGR